MLASVAWLKELCPFDAPPERVAATLTARGLTVDALTGTGDDAVLDVNIPANRPDCLGHLGIARELSAAFGVPLVPRPAPPPGSGPDAPSTVRIQIEDSDLCARYTARIVRGVRVGPSPAWVVRRLEACGLRALNNVVDASNLVLLETGNPIHFFDLDRVTDATIRVRRAQAGERIVTLDGIERTLVAGMLVIADARRPVALAGVMGGADSQIVASTRDVLIEAAWFRPRSVRATAKALGLPTDASHRFERGVDPEGVLAAQARAVALLAELAGGEPSPGVADEWPGRSAPKRIALSRSRVDRLLGYAPRGIEIERSLRAVGLSPVLQGDASVEITVPSWRVDLERDVDVIEEIARDLGYDRIPCHLPQREGVPAARAGLDLAAERVREFFAHQGFCESFCYSMIAASEDDPFVLATTPPALKIANPIAESMARLRRTLVPGLVRMLDQNVRRGTADVRLFEHGRVFLRSPERFPDERVRAAFAWSGAAVPRHWKSAAHTVDLPDASGLLEALLEFVRPGILVAREAPAGPLPSGLHPGKIALFAPSQRPANLLESALPAFGAAVAWTAALHPALLRAYDLATEVYVGEVDLTALQRTEARPWSVAPIPKVPSVTRDLSLVLHGGVPFARVLAALEREAPPAPARFDVIDRYAGPPLAPGEFSLTVRVMLEPLDRTLTDAEVEEYRQRLVARLAADLDSKLRE